MNKVPKVLAGASLALVLAATGSAQAGTFATITIDDVYADWAGIPVVDSDPLDNPGFVDFADTQIANDNDFLYIRNTYWGPKSLGTFMGIDIDDDFDTGFNIFGLNLIGQDAGWQNDFPFTSGDNVFNDGQGMSGDFFGSGAGLLSPFADTTTREMAISLDVLLNEDNSALFPDNTIRILFWTDQSAGDVTGVINYTLAVPEPASMALLGLGGLAMLKRRR
jgi:PEP-CTERM motif